MRASTIAFALLLAAAAAPAPEPQVTAGDLRRVPATEAKDALRTFRIKTGYRLELAAAEPLVMDPIAMCFDEDGRCYVVEMRDYSERREERLGRVSRLEDTDNDGRFDKTSVFAESLPWPTGLLYASGGVYVLSSPDLLFLKDTDGDGKADERQVLFTGFGAGMERLNVQALPNSLTWGLDNRIHGATGPNGARLSRPSADRQGPPLVLRGQDFSFDPRTLDIRAESGGGQYGLSFDHTGRKFVCSNSAHIQAVAYDLRYAALNPHYALPPPAVNIPLDGPAAEVFRISPDEPWRVIRTKWRVAGLVSGPIEGGGRASGYFTGATGVTLYTGNAMPELLGNAFIGDAGGNLVHRKQIVHLKSEISDFKSPIPAATRPADEQNVEFLASTDNWFRPVQMANAPDGCLYIIDMYREVIEHPWSLPEPIKKHLDLNSGNDRGRLYRVLPETFQRPPQPRLSAASIEELVGTLEHHNGWHRHTAARLIHERRDARAVPLLSALLGESKSALARMHAMYALDGLSALGEEQQVLPALADADPLVRRHAVRLSEGCLKDGVPSAALWDALNRLTLDEDPQVSYQLAWSLGVVKHDGRADALFPILARGVEDSWARHAVLNSAASNPARLFGRVLDSRPLNTGPGGRPVESLARLVRMIGAANRPEQVAAALSRLKDLREPRIAFPLVLALADGLRQANSSLSVAGFDVAPLLDAARQLAADATAADADRRSAVEFLALASYADAAPILLKLLDRPQPQPVQLAALATLDRFTSLELASELLKRLPALAPRLRAEAISLLLKRPERAIDVLRAIESESLRASELSSTQQAMLRTHSNAELKAFAIRVLAAPPPSARQDVVKAFAPALTLPGDAARGKATFIERCSSCHRPGELGHSLGPDLLTVRSAGRESLLNSILDPNREVAPQYLAYVIDTRSGDTLAGIVASDTPASVILRQAYGVETVIPRNEIRRMRASGQSVMPEGLEENLRPQDLADLLEFISAPPK